MACDEGSGGVVSGRCGAVRRTAAVVQRVSVAAGAAALLATLPIGLHAQQGPAFDQSSLAMEQPAMATLLEKTIFKVDVAWLEVWFTPAVDERLLSLAERRPESYRDSIARVAWSATDVLARLHFERNVSSGQFLDGLQGSARRAREAGIISDEAYENIVVSSPEWYDFLKARGVRDGDEMLYRIRGDTLRTVYLAVDGAVLLDQRDVGPENGLSVLGGYLAPGSDFRKGLIDSAVRRTATGAGPARATRR